MLRTEVVGADETFLDLPIESREVSLPLGSPSSDTKSTLRLDKDVFDREAVRVFVMCWCFVKWPMRENELVTDAVEDKRNIIDNTEFLKC